MSRDRHRLSKKLQELSQASKAGQDVSQKVRTVSAAIKASRDSVAARKSCIPDIHFPLDLPVSDRADEIRQAILDHQVIIVAGETGSGKTTQLPKICLQAGRGVAGMIAHTQPRRLAARSISARIAEEMGVELGSEVGFQIRFSDASSENTLIKLMTDGILLSEVQQDRWLNQYDTIIIDEAHERSLNIDFLLGYIKRLLKRRRDLKLIITSATIDVNKFSMHFNDAPVIEVTGRTYPVDILYRPPAENDEDAELSTAVLNAVQEIQRLERKRSRGHSDILVFLSGEKEIRDVALELRKARLVHTEVLPLYARLSAKEQNRIFAPHTGQRIVLSTNVAETSLTVPGIGYVVDSGKARISRYSVRSKIQRLPIEAVSRASANQRAGRCGRLGPGTCIRLYDQTDFESRPAFTDTEITRTNLGAVILKMLSLGLGTIEEFPFIDKPEANAVSDGFRLLFELGAVDKDQRLTSLGRKLAKFPVDPQFGRMLLEASSKNCLRELLIIVSALSIQDPRERPLEKQQAADECKRQFEHPESDFLAFVRLWDFYEEQRQNLTQNNLRKFCKQHFLSWLRMREWRDVHRQLHLLCRELGLEENKTDASFEAIHQSLLSGLLSQVARLLDEGDYLAARNRKFRIFPGSSLFKHKYKWLLAAELVETSQLFARMNARIEPEWVEAMAGHLVKREYLEPHWVKKKGQVMAGEKVSLYGLTLVEKRLVPFRKIDPATCREMLIREGLVALQMETRAGFYQHNKTLVEKVEQLEEKTRRRDLLVDEESVFHFYDSRLPASILDVPSLERWWRSLDREKQDSLKLRREDLVSENYSSVDLDQYPDQIETGNMALKLDYRFDPGKSGDGISVDVPVSALRQLREDDLDWLVPGLLQEKCIALIKALPKQLRKQFVPVPDIVEKVLPLLTRDEGSLRLQLVTHLKRLTGVEIQLAHWDDYSLSEHLRMNIQVRGAEGEVLGSGRDLYLLREQFADHIEHNMVRHSKSTIEREKLKDWTFGELPDVYEVNHGGLKVKAYPALVDEGDTVSLKLMDNDWQAKENTRMGVVKLLMLKQSQQIRHLKKLLFQDQGQLLQIGKLGKPESLQQQVITVAYIDAFRLDSQLPENKKAFEQMYEACRSDLTVAAESAEKLIIDIASEYRETSRQIKDLKGLNLLAMRKDLERQLDGLVYDGFFLETPREWLEEIPRFLKAIQCRIEKFPRQSVKDAVWSRELENCHDQYEDRRKFCLAQKLRDRHLELYRWMLEEYRVSLFAQHLGTRFPVSAKRLNKLWNQTGIR